MSQMEADIPMEESQGDQIDSQDIHHEPPASHAFIPPSVDTTRVLSGDSYTHLSAIPDAIKADMSTECVLGVDEAGRGPVLGPMVYALAYLPRSQHRSLLAETHHFDDSKALTPAVRSALMQTLCTRGTDLHAATGWAIRSLSAQDISSAQLRSTGASNLNEQAMSATIALIQNVLDLGVNVKEVYIDTIGPPASYQRKLEKVFPALGITVEKKADSLFPCVSAASVVAKVTRDVALEVLWRTYRGEGVAEEDVEKVGWGSGYPSDARCSSWMKGNMDPVFGWGSECRFSWGTAKELLEARGAPCRVDWPEGSDPEADSMKLTGFFLGADEQDEKMDEVAGHFGRRVPEAVF
ncbi:ribonuclease H-like protein [Hortaea werneckii]|nr:ribonuclease H-like protein [Hortaea werneckii]